jgi:hypothetical protein
MDSIGPDLLETVTPAEAGEARRLTTKEKVKALLGLSATTDDSLLDQLIDRVSADCAAYCNLAADSAGAFPTFGAETLRATWYSGRGHRGDTLLLPWRPKLSVSAVSEDGADLVAGTDYRLVDGSVLQRISSDFGAPWVSAYPVIVTMTAGWALPVGVDPALEGRVIEQVKLQYMGRKRDDAIRSLAVPGLYQASYAVVGGDTIGESGLLISLEAALERYRRIAV